MANISRAHRMFNRYRSRYQEAAVSLYQVQVQTETYLGDTTATYSAAAVLAGLFNPSPGEKERSLFGESVDLDAVLELRTQLLSDEGITLSTSDKWSVAGVDYTTKSIIARNYYGNGYLTTVVALRKASRD